MKKLSVIFLLVAIAVLLVTVPAFAGGHNPNAMNAQFIRWQERANIIHIIVFNDDGRHGVPAYVDAGQPLLFGYEYWWETLEDAQDFLDNPLNDITLEISGDLSVAAFSVKSFFQDPFYSEPRSGPFWAWDHDGDGLGDRDGDGIDDWPAGYKVFFRYPYSGLPSGSYMFTFTLYTDGVPFADSITIVVP